jgi:hypothetical protein
MNAEFTRQLSESLASPALGDCTGLSDLTQLTRQLSQSMAGIDGPQLTRQLSQSMAGIDGAHALVDLSLSTSSLTSQSMAGIDSTQLTRQLSQSMAGIDGAHALVDLSLSRHLSSSLDAIGQQQAATPSAAPIPTDLAAHTRLPFTPTMFPAHGASIGYGMHPQPQLSPFGPISAAHYMPLPGVRQPRFQQGPFYFMPGPAPGSCVQLPEGVGGSQSPHSYPAPPGMWAMVQHGDLDENKQWEGMPGGGGRGGGTLVAAMLRYVPNIDHAACISFSTLWP